MCRRWIMNWSIASSANGRSSPSWSMAVSRLWTRQRTHLAHVDGVMLGRAAYQNPAYCWRKSMRASSAVRRWTWMRRWRPIAEYVERSDWREGARLHPLIKPMLGLYNGRPGARLFRRHLSEQAPRDGAGIAVLREALAFVKQRKAA